MNDITLRLAAALRAGLTPTGDTKDMERVHAECVAALAAFDAQPKRWTVFVRDADNTGTTYITCVEAEDVEAAKAAASALCREDWGYDETDQLHILGVIAGDIGDVVEWDDCE